MANYSADSTLPTPSGGNVLITPLTLTCNVTVYDNIGYVFMFLNTHHAINPNPVLN